MMETVSNRPTSSVPNPYHFPRFEQRRIANGVTVISSGVSKLPLVSIVALMDAGATQDPAGREGLAVLTAKLLMEGTVTRDGSTLVEAFEQLGASVDVGASWDSAMVRLTVLASQVEAAVLLLTEVLREPGFRERDVARLKSERAAERLQLQADPRELADESFERILYGASSRYGQPQGGGNGSVAAITREDVAAFYRGEYVPQRLTTIIAGDVGSSQVVGMMEDRFGGWLGTTPKSQLVTDEIAERGRRIRIVPKTDAPQSELRIGHRGVARSHPDYFPLLVMNAILGGLFSSRINLNLREEHGYTYGAYSGFNWRRKAGPFVISTAVESGVSADATREIFAELERIRETPVSAEELSLATSYLGGVFPIRYETTSAIADALATLVTYGLPANYFDTYREHIRAVTPTDVLRVAREHLHPEQLLVVAVGDADQIEGPLSELNLGPVETANLDEMTASE